MTDVLTIAFIVAVTSFFKEQFGFSGRTSLLAAFFVALVVGFAPALATQFPAIAPWIENFIRVVVLFLSAAGSVDALKQFRRTNAEPLNIKGQQPK